MRMKLRSPLIFRLHHARLLGPQTACPKCAVIPLPSFRTGPKISLHRRTVLPPSTLHLDIPVRRRNPTPAISMMSPNPRVMMSPTLNLMWPRRWAPGFIRDFELKWSIGLAKTFPV
jgi:hypothetical protein